MAEPSCAPWLETPSRPYSAGSVPRDLHPLAVAAMADAGVRHRGDRQGVKIARHGPGAICLEGVSSQGAQEGLGHLAAHAVGAGEKRTFLTTSTS